jgi:hypothetical protein
VPIPVAPAVHLTDDERAQLLAWSRRSKSANALAMRSRIVLVAADGLSNTAIADKLDVHITSARKWRTRFVSTRLDGLLDEPRPGRPRTTARVCLGQCICDLVTLVAAFDDHGRASISSQQGNAGYVSPASLSGFPHRTTAGQPTRL